MSKFYRCLFKFGILVSGVAAILLILLGVGLLLIPTVILKILQYAVAATAVFSGVRILGSLLIGAIRR